MELLRVLVSDDGCLRGLTRIIETIINADLCQAERDLLLSFPLFAARTPNRSKLRPIVPGGVLAGRLAFKALPALSSLFPTHEHFGLTTKGGAQTLVHSLNAVLAANPDFLCLSLDIKNAFNSIPRSALLQELFRHPSLSAIW